jgi:hypothetical protein
VVFKGVIRYRTIWRGKVVGKVKKRKKRSKRAVNLAKIEVKKSSERPMTMAEIVEELRQPWRGFEPPRIEPPRITAGPPDFRKMVDAISAHLPVIPARDDIGDAGQAVPPDSTERPPRGHKVNESTRERLPEKPTPNPSERRARIVREIMESKRDFKNETKVKALLARLDAEEIPFHRISKPTLNPPQKWSDMKPRTNRYKDTIAVLKRDLYPRKK